MNSIQQYRQPMVTATGIFLGFMLNYISTWIPNAFSRQLFKDVVFGISMTICIALLLIVLFRILRMNYPKDREGEYYKQTLRLFLAGISIPFFAFIIVMIEKMVINVLVATAAMMNAAMFNVM